MSFRRWLVGVSSSAYALEKCPLSLRATIRGQLIPLGLS
jgi:hypothetical protein